MTVKEVLKLSSVLLNMYDELKPLFEEGEVSDDVKREYNSLLTALNLCVSEIACDYIPNIHEEYVHAVDGKIFFASLNKNIKDILKIETERGKDLKYRIFPNHVAVNYNGYVNIIYSYTPELLNFEDGILNFGGRVSEKCLALGVASEYCFINSFFDDAAIWDKRFKESLRIAVSKKGEIRLPKRRWM